MSYTPAQAIAAAGNNQGFLALSGDRYMLGRSRTAPSSGAAGSGMFRLWGIQDAAPVPGAPNVVNDPGDDGIVARFTFNTTDDTSFDANMAVYDMEMAAAFTNSILISDALGSSLIRSSRQLPSYAGIAIFQSFAQQYPNGASKWHSVVLPRVTVRVLGRQSFEGQTPAVFRVRITPQFSAYNHGGVTYSAAVDGQTNADIVDRWGTYPITLHRSTGNGSTPTFNLDEKPAGATMALGWADGIPLTVLSVNDSSLPYTITYSTNPAPGAAVITAYQYIPTD